MTLFCLMFGQNSSYGTVFRFTGTTSGAGTKLCISGTGIPGCSRPGQKLSCGPILVFSQTQESGNLDSTQQAVTFLTRKKQARGSNGKPIGWILGRFKIQSLGILQPSTTSRFGNGGPAPESGVTSPSAFLPGPSGLLMALQVWRFRNRVLSSHRFNRMAGYFNFAWGGQPVWNHPFCGVRRS